MSIYNYFPSAKINQLVVNNTSSIMLVTKLLLIFQFQCIILVSGKSKRAAVEYVLPEESDILDKDDLPPLYVPGQKQIGLISGLDENLNKIRNKIKNLETINKVVNLVGDIVSNIPVKGKKLRLALTTIL